MGAPLFQAPQFLPPDFQSGQPRARKPEEPQPSEEPARTGEARRPEGQRGSSRQERVPSRTEQVAEERPDETRPRRAAAKNAEPAKTTPKKAEPAKTTAKKAEAAKAAKTPAKKAPAKKAPATRPAAKKAAKKATAGEATRQAAEDQPPPAKTAKAAKRTEAPTAKASKTTPAKASKGTAAKAATTTAKATKITRSRKTVDRVAADAPAKPENEPAAEPITQPAEARDVAVAAAEPQELAGAPATRTPERARLWTRIRTRPEYAPELLAVAAVAELGPQARAWADEFRATYPAASPDGLARLATRQFTRLSAAAGMAGLATGLAGGAVELAGVAWAEARLVLHLAAAYGQDPTDPERVVDLLVLTQVHETPEAAREATTAVAVEGAGENPQRLLALLSTRTRGWSARRFATRLLPGAGALLAIADTTSRVQRLAARAAAYYRS